MKARRWSGLAAVTIAGGALLSACGPSAREKQLEARVHELEQKKAASPAAPSGWPEVVLESPSPHAYAQEPAAPARPAAPRASTTSHSTARPAPRAQAPATTTARTTTGTTASHGTTTPHGTATTTASTPATAPHQPVEHIPDSEVHGDNDWPASTTEPAKETARETEPAVTVPANTELSLRLETAVSSATSTVGDRVTARVERAVGPDGNIVLPGGTVLYGRVSEADSAGRVKGRGRLAVSFDRIVIRGRSYPVEATVLSAVAADSHARDATIIGGSAVAGAILGGIKGGKSGAAKGAVIGGAAGTGAVLVTKGQEVEMPAGSRWTVRTRNAIGL